MIVFPSRRAVYCDDRESEFGGRIAVALGLWRGGLAEFENWYSAAREPVPQLGNLVVKTALISISETKLYEAM